MAGEDTPEIVDFRVVPFDLPLPDLAAAFRKSQSVPPRTTSGVQNAPTGTHVTEKALIEWLQIEIGRLRCKIGGMSVVVTDGIDLRISHRR